MKEACVKTLIPVLIALISAFGAYSYRFEYVAAVNEQEKGRLVMTMMKEVCTQEGTHGTPP